MRPIALATLLLASLLLVSCTGMLYQHDPRSAEEHRNQAEALIFAGDHAGAAAAMAMAIRKNPYQESYYLRHGEILEALGESKKARKTYLRGRRQAQEDSDAHRAFTYHLGLLYAGKLEELDDAGRLLEELPPESDRRHDLQAAILLEENENREALRLLNLALAGGTSKEMAGRILFHAARAYVQLGDLETATKTLYQAINLSENLGLTRDIERLWQQLKETAAQAPGRPH